MNTLIQVVTLGVDPELRTYGDDGKSRVTFSGAVPRRYSKNGEDATNWFNYVAFGATADFIAKYFKKGSKMLITGEVNNNNYTVDGVKHYGVQILIQNVEFYGKKSDGEVSRNDSNAQAAEAPASEAQKPEAPASEAPADNTSKPAESAPETTSYDAYGDF